MQQAIYYNKMTVPAASAISVWDTLLTNLATQFAGNPTELARVTALLQQCDGLLLESESADIRVVADGIYGQTFQNAPATGGGHKISIGSITRIDTNPKTVRVFSTAGGVLHVTATK